MLIFDNISPLSHAHRGSYTIPMAKVQAKEEPIIIIGPWGRDLDADNWSFQIPKDGDIKAITIATGSVLNSLIFTVQDASGATVTLKYGGASGADVHQLKFAANEYITSIAGAYGTSKGSVSVTSLTFITNLRKYGPFGLDYNVEYKAAAVVKFSPPVLGNAKVAGFYGYADSYIERIGFYVKPVQPGRVISVGPWGRETSSSNGTFETSIGSNIKGIIVGHGVVIDSLTFIVQVANGQEKTVKFGGNGGGSSKVVFASGEYITTIAGAYGYWQNQNGIYVTAISFTTNLGTTYGPYGHEEDNLSGVTTDTVKFSSPPLENAEVAGFFASTDNYIQNIGINIRPKLIFEV